MLTLTSKHPVSSSYAFVYVSKPHMWLTYQAAASIDEEML